MQQYAIERIKAGANIFLTGSGGVGKSWVINQVKDNDTLLCAPTGIAALNIGGVTCHKLFGLPIGLPTQKDFKTINPKVAKLLSSKKLKRILIDEVGMLRADSFDMINHRLQQARKNSLPFGGVQLVVVGDFYQLSPIVSRSEESLFYQSYKTAFAFGSKAWNFETVVLDKVYRQEDLEHVSILNSIRKKDNKHTEAFNWLVNNTLPYKDGGEELLHLCSYKTDAAKVNSIHYNKLNTSEKVYHGFASKGKWSNDVPVEQTIKLREGCKVIMCANDPDGSYVNGERGVIKSLHKDGVMVTRDGDGKDVLVTMFIWEKYSYSSSSKGITKTVDSSYAQIPLLLGYGITIHKSQGMSLDGLSLDVGSGCFGHGQLYVALSRAKDLNKLSLVKPISPKDLIVEDEVKVFYGDT